MRNLKIVLLFILTIAITLSMVSISTFAKNDDVLGNKSLMEKIDKSKASDIEKRKIIDLIKNYGLKVVDIKDIPADVKPGEANSAAEIVMLINEGRIRIEEIKSILEKTHSLSNNEVVEIEAQSTGTERGSYYVGFSYYFNLDASYTYLWSSQRNSNYISSVNSTYSYLSGFHPLVGWTQTYANGWVINDGYGIHAECNGTWDTYIYVPLIGLVLIDSTPGGWWWDSYFVP